ncbi:MAG: NfeD family protein [Bdellovibrionaceae bacterium]|nr:NfeD family protein [Pseudobdellovibrionaceae bacterium]
MNASLLWLIAGLILLIAEMTTGTIVLIFISIGCFVAAAASMLAPDMLAVHFIVCAVVSLVGTFALRKPLQRRLLKNTNMQADIGKELVVDANIEPHKRNRITYQGTTWDASNIGSDSIAKGDHVVIVGLDGNVLLIRKLD